jgi:hypothetical protein
MSLSIWLFGILDLFGFGIWSMWICLVLEFRICLDL